MTSKLYKFATLLALLFCFSASLIGCGGGGGGSTASTPAPTPDPNPAVTTVEFGSQLARPSQEWATSTMNVTANETIWRSDTVTPSGGSVTISSARVILPDGVTLVAGSTYMVSSADPHQNIADSVTSATQTVNIVVPAGTSAYLQYAVKATRAGFFSPKTVIETSVGVKEALATLTVAGTTNAACTNPAGNHGDTRTDSASCVATTYQCQNGTWQVASSAPATGCGTPEGTIRVSSNRDASFTVVNTSTGETKSGSVTATTQETFNVQIGTWELRCNAVAGFTVALVQKAISAGAIADAACTYTPVAVATGTINVNGDHPLETTACLRGQSSGTSDYCQDTDFSKLMPAGDYQLECDAASGYSVVASPASANLPAGENITFNCLYTVIPPSGPDGPSGDDIVPEGPTSPRKAGQ